MKSYNNFVFEYKQTSRSIPIQTEEDIVDTIRTECSDFRFTHNPIWRNTDQPLNYYLINPTASTRKSRDDGANYNTIILDNSLYWDKYPKRENSVIGMLGGFSSHYGASRFRVIPFNGAKFGVANCDDMWYSFNYLKEKTGMELKWINEFVVEATNHLNLKKINDDTFQQFIVDMKSIEESIKSDSYLNAFSSIEKFSFYEKFLSIFHTKLTEGKSFTQILNEYIKPSDNNIKLLTYDKLINLDTNDEPLEVYTDSNCILIPVNKISIIKGLV